MNTENPKDIAQVVTKVSRRGRKPTGIVKDNVCIRMTPDNETYLADIGGGSKSTGVDRLIEMHRRNQLSQ